MKRYFAIFLAVLMIMAMVPFSAAATSANELFVSVDWIGADPGDEVSVDGETKEIGVDAFASIPEAIAAANTGDTIFALAGEYTVTNTIIVNKAVTIKGAADFGTKITTTGGNAVFRLAAAATLDGIYVHKTDKQNQTLVAITANGTTIKNSRFVGQYAQGDSETVRAILPNANVNYNLVGNHFDSVRQPAYLQGPGNVENNFVKNTRGWVMCVNYDATFTNNSFEGNAVDIAIIENNQTESEYFNDVAAISAANNGAYVENQLLKISAKGGQLYQTIAITEGGETTYYQTLAAAVSAASEGATINVYPGVYHLSSTLSINKALTIQGPNFENNPTGDGVRGDEAIITGPNRAIRIRSNDVVIEGLTISTAGTAIWVNGADGIDGLTINNNIFDGNSEAFGSSSGSAASPNSINNLVFTNNVVTNNSARSFSNYTGIAGTNFVITGNDFVDVLAGIHLGNVDSVVVAENTFVLGNADYWAILLADSIGNISITDNNFLYGGAAVSVWETTDVLGPVLIADNVIKDQSVVGISIRQREGTVTDATQFTIYGNIFSGTSRLIRNEGTGKINAPENIVTIDADESTVQIDYSELDTDDVVRFVRDSELELELPANILPGNVDVTVKKVTKSAPEGFKLLGSAYSFTMTDESGDPVTEFTGTMSISFYYDPAEVTNPDNLAVYWYNPTTEEWEAQESVVDKENNKVTAEVDHWSEFAVMEAPAQDTTDPTDPADPTLPETGTNVMWLLPLGILLLAGGYWIRRQVVA